LHMCFGEKRKLHQMFALLSHQAGGPETLVMEDVPRPNPTDDQILIRVFATALNYPDGLMLADKYQDIQPRPFCPGSEMAGIVEEVGSAVHEFKKGDRVFGLSSSAGGLAEFAVIKAAKCFAMPDTMEFPVAASLLITYGTTLHALWDHAKLKSGQTMLVLGAAGGVGLAAVQLGKAMDARVIAAASSLEKAEIAMRAGADRSLVYDRSPATSGQMRALTEQFKQASGDGANVVFDPLGGNYTEPAMRALAEGGRYLVIGFAAGIPAIKANLLLLKAASASGVYWGKWADNNPRLAAQQVSKIVAWWKEGKIKPHISVRLPFSQAAEGFHLLARRQAIGKIVISASP